MSADGSNEQTARWSTLSERLLGEPAEVTVAEAEELLKTAGVDPATLKSSLYRRMLERSERHSDAGQPVPPLLRKAVEDLQPRARAGAPALSQTAASALRLLLQEIAALPQRLNAGLSPAFIAAYRNRTDLSEGDKKILDEIVDELRKKKP